MAARRGSADAFADLAMSHANDCWRAAYAITLSENTAEDAVQEAFAQAWRTIGRFDPDRAFGPWIKKIAVNCALAELRVERARGAHDEEALARLPAPSPDSQLGPVWSAVTALDLDRRVPIVMHYVLGFTYAEIAVALNSPIGTIASRVTRGLDQIRRSLEVTNAARD